ncbi:MgtC/SapB family protein [Dongia sp.]|uniref:MgtC/SapB family protein n=1 Tax=Dongia sp. TaxID=1977262 RepID=UPI003752959F
MNELDLDWETLSHPLELLVSLAVGLLIGMEREWRQQRDADQPDEHAGLRTFGLFGLLGGIAGLFEQNAAWIAAATLLAVAAVLIAQRRKGDRNLPLEDVTTLAAALVTTMLGALATIGMPQLAATAAVVIVVLLHLKPTLHRWIGALSKDELRAVLRLLVISLVILPVLPDQGYGPYEALNPRSIWWYVVLISLLSFAGYLAIRILGPKRGYLATGLFGGMVSSTATTAALARLAKQDQKSVAPLAAGIALANGVSVMRMLMIVAAIYPPLALAAAWPLGCFALVAVACALLLWRFQTARGKGKAMEIANPFGIGPALKLAAVLATVQVLAAFLEDRYGQAGLQGLAAIAGLVDADAISLTVARSAAGGAEIGSALTALLIAVLANAVFKSVLLFSAGGKIAVWGIGALALMCSAAGIAWLIPMPLELETDQPSG